MRPSRRGPAIKPLPLVVTHSCCAFMRLWRLSATARKKPFDAAAAVISTARPMKTTNITRSIASWISTTRCRRCRRGSVTSANTTSIPALAAPRSCRWICIARAWVAIRFCGIQESRRLNHLKKYFLASAISCRRVLYQGDRASGESKRVGVTLRMTPLRVNWGLTG